MVATKNQRSNLRRDIQKYIQIKDQIEKLEQLKDELNASIKKAMSTYDIFEMQVDHRKIRYYASVRSNFNNACFKRDYPELFEKYNYSSSYTYLRIEKPAKRKGS